MQKVILKIEGMTCSACSNSLEKYLNKQDGIINASVNLVLAQALIEYEDSITINDLNNYVKQAGYKSLGIYDKVKEKETKNDRNKLIVFSLLAILVIYISMSHMVGLPVIPFLHMIKHPANYSICLLILSLLFLYYGFDIFKNGYKNLIHKSPNMDTLVTIGVFASFLYSLYGTIMILNGQNEYVENLYFESSCIVLYFVKLGRFIDAKSKAKTSEAIKDLVRITPEKALLKTKGKELEVTLDEITKGDILICKPGMKVAVDGTIVDGISHIDEAFITGESVPVKKDKGQKVVAGSLNIDGYIEYKAEKIGANSTISEIVRLVLEAINTKPKISKIADRVSSIFVPCIIIIAFLTLMIYLITGFGINISLNYFVSVLVVACPCALGLATPLAIVVSEGLCAKNKILVKTSQTLENASKVNTIVFDKTGTLTYGNLKISKIYNYSDYKELELLKIVASLEAKSTHPIANAFINYAKNKKINLDNISKFNNIAGMGLKANLNNKEYYVGNNKILSKLNIHSNYTNDEDNLKNNGNSIVYVVENNKIIALIGVKDIVRDNARSVIKKLKSLGKRVIMLTGDNEVTAQIIAKELGIEEVIANVMPKDKTLKIKELMNDNKVMMVGDGINDAPSLALATIGVSLKSGTEIASNSADVILTNDNLVNIVNLIIISKKTIRNIKQNLFWAFFYNTCMIPIACGIFKKIGLSLNPMLAAFAMTISSLTVIFNALRLRKIKLERGY